MKFRQLGHERKAASQSCKAGRDKSRGLRVQASRAINLLLNNFAGPVADKTNVLLDLWRLGHILSIAS